MMAPKGTPAAIVARLNAEVAKILNRAEVRQEWAAQGAVPMLMTPDEFGRMKRMGQGKGFLLVASSPLTRSSHHAGEDFQRLRAARDAFSNLFVMTEIVPSREAILCTRRPRAPRQE